MAEIEIIATLVVFYQIYTNCIQILYRLSTGVNVKRLYTDYKQIIYRLHTGFLE